MSMPTWFQERRHTEMIMGLKEEMPDRHLWYDFFCPHTFVKLPLRIAFFLFHLFLCVPLHCFRRNISKERMKTVSVALVLCLNIGVDPPDVQRPNPCARTECWVDPVGLNPQKAMAKISLALQKGYERWQPRARYKAASDPTIEDVRRLCQSLRRNAKDDRILFHYNGHGVPKPTASGEIWVFNKNYTQVSYVFFASMQCRNAYCTEVACMCPFVCMYLSAYI
ncbi:unnamed protein product [Gongylonema pulchrum]|uniref:Raptor N-terminal CASPase-like domain-containing protein n=1 Tax=Gongylonema pulchrum TaxID=637853 RepID=A0A3P7PGK4_9BILA|nr:unnamed protein product [Gongylonema pulchrum]